MPKFTSALLGCGRMGQCHAEALKRLRTSLVAVADPLEAACVKVVDACEQKEPPIACSSLTQMLQIQVPDLLVVATTADGHASQALEAIEAGVRLILLEKPLTTSLRSCQQLLKACEESGARIAVNHQMRFLPQYQSPKKLLATKEFGGFNSMHVAAGNFGLAMNGTHYVEAFRFLSDQSPIEVSAWLDNDLLPNPRGAQFQDVSGCIRVTSSSGCRLYIDASADQGHGVQVTYMARNGRITVDELTGTLTSIVRSPEYSDAPTTRYGMPAEIDQLQIPPVELVDSSKAVMESLISGNGYPSLADATLAVKTLVGAYHSHRQGGSALRLADIADDDSEVFPWA